METLREGSLAQTLMQYADPVLGAVGGKSVGGHYGGNGYHYEADEVARCVRQRQPESAIMPLSQSLALASMIDRAKDLWNDVQR